MLLRPLWTVVVLAATITVHPSPARSAEPIFLTDQRGSHFAFDSLRGSPVVVTFVSAHCDDACPIMEAQIAQIVDRLGNSPRALRFLTVTLDPERDTLLDMRRIANTFDANPARWIVATGNVRDVHALMKRFNVRTERDARGFASAHTTFVYLLDSQLKLEKTILPSTNFVSEFMQENTR